MSAVVAFVVPGAPVPKGRPRVTRTGHAFTDARTREYEARVKSFALAAAANTGRVPVFESGVPVRLTVRVYRAAARGDLDNLVKSVSDPCNGVVWHDDRQVVSLDAWMGVDRANPRVEVEVSAA